MAECVTKPTECGKTLFIGYSKHPFVQISVWQRHNETQKVQIPQRVRYDGAMDQSWPMSACDLTMTRSNNLLLRTAERVPAVGVS